MPPAIKFLEGALWKCDIGKCVEVWERFQKNINVSLSNGEPPTKKNRSEPDNKLQKTFRVSCKLAGRPAKLLDHTVNSPPEILNIIRKIDKNVNETDNWNLQLSVPFTFLSIWITWMSNLHASIRKVWFWYLP